MDFEALPTKDVAYHMTLFDWDLFWAVHEYELLYHTFGRHHFNKVSAFKFDFCMPEERNATHNWLKRQSKDRSLSGCRKYFPKVHFHAICFKLLNEQAKLFLEALPFHKESGGLCQYQNRIRSFPVLEVVKSEGFHRYSWGKVSDLLLVVVTRVEFDSYFLLSL